MKRAQAIRRTLTSRRGELLIESVLAIALLAILFAAVVLLLTTSLNMVNQAVANARTQQATVDAAVRQDFLTDGSGKPVTITFATDIATLGGSTAGMLTEAGGFTAFAGG